MVSPPLRVSAGRLFSPLMASPPDGEIKLVIAFLVLILDSMKFLAIVRYCGIRQHRPVVRSILRKCRHD